MKSNAKFFNKLKKQFLAHFLSIFPIFSTKKILENLAVTYSFIWVSRVSDKIPRKCVERETDGRTDTISEDPSSYQRGSKNIKHCNGNNSSSFLMYLDKNNLHGKTMPHIFSVDFLGFERDEKS